MKKGLMKMDEKYVLELGKMTNSIENLIKNQDRHYSELRDMLQKQRDHTTLEITNLKKDMKNLEKERIKVEEKLKERIVSTEKIDIKIIAYMTIISLIASLAFRLLPTLIKTFEITPIG